MSKIISIVACDKNNGIGFEGKIPWKNKQDQQFFKQKTFGKTVIMGRKTMDSLPNKKLPHRLNIVLTTGGDLYRTTPCGDSHPLTYGPFGKADIYTALNFAKDYFADYSVEIFIIGGSQIYELAFKENLIDEVYMTNIEGDYECDIFFPIHYIQNWKKEKSSVEGLSVDHYRKNNE